MNCPKCNNKIDEKMLICPGCKKVLKLVCPKCKTINKSNTCKKCGFVIITKCYKCGKINQTINDICTKCGFSTHTSVAINSSNVDEFACLTIEFPNISTIKSALGSTKLADKFKANLDYLISNYSSSVGVSREILKDIYVIRFNKDSSFAESANNAMNAAIQIQNLITELNFKMKKLTESALQCNIAILKRNIYSQPNQYCSGFNIKLIYHHKKDFNLLNNLQIITDSHIYNALLSKFDLSTLTTQVVKDEMMTFFELNLKKYITIPKISPEEEEGLKLSKLNIFDDIQEESEDENSMYDFDCISFNEVKCDFKKIKSLKIIPEIIENLKNNSKKIISIKGEKELLPQEFELLEELNQIKAFKNIFKITCCDEMKYKPYGFFYELISTIYKFPISPKLFNDDDFKIFDNIDPSGFIKDLINLNKRTFPHPEDIRYSLFDIFFNIFHMMPKSLIYIENFEKIDETSYEVLQILLEKFDGMNISYLITADNDFSLHKNCHFLLANANYIEITSEKSSIKEIIARSPYNYDNILDSYYIKKIAQNTKGSVSYFNSSIDYLIKKNILNFEKNKLEIKTLENILIPSSLNELAGKKLKLLSEDTASFNLFCMFLLLGPKIDLPTANLLGANDLKILKNLVKHKYIYVHDNLIYISNYTLFKTNFNTQIPLETKQKIAKELLQKIFLQNKKHPYEPDLYKILEQNKQEFLALEELSQLNASLGDFSAYLNCSIRFLKLLDDHVNENSQKSIEDYKIEVYENISNLLYRYSPNEIHNIAQIILNNLEKTTEDKKIINFCNKMLQGCLISGNYSYALELVHKILMRFSNASINPDDKNFNETFFLISLIKIEILFSIGDLKTCEECGEEILNILTPEIILRLKPEHLSIKQFEKVILDSMAFVGITKIILLKRDEQIQNFIEKIQTNIGNKPEIFDLLIYLEKIIKGRACKLPSDMMVNDNKFSKIALNIIKAFCENHSDFKKFAQNIYQAKITAKIHKLSQIELICDLLIGYAYFKLKKERKSFNIYQIILDASEKNGLKMITYTTRYLIALLKFEQQDIEISYGIVNNAIIQLEKDLESGDLMLFLYRVLLSKILINKNQQEAAEMCKNNAAFIKEKYSLSFEIE